MSGEFDLIRSHFTRPVQHSVLGVGDDCAIVAPRAGHELLISTDMLVAGTHFLPEVAPETLGWKTAAVNLSDIAAMGGAPRWITLALSLPANDEAWTAALAEGFAACCAAFDVDWIGGDTTRGPLNLCATVFGEVPAGGAVRRDGAVAGDDVWISGMPGLAHLGLRHLIDQTPLQGDWQEACLRALHQPQPRVALGQALRGQAHAMLDVSDGLAGDLGHILERSECGATLDEASLPMGPVLAACQDWQLAQHALLHGGDDYELLFCAPITARPALQTISETLGLAVHRIGTIDNAPGLRLRLRNGEVQTLPALGFDHFA